MSAQPDYPLRIERGGLAPAIDLPPARMTPAQIPLTLSADVLRLPYLPATRLVLAEIVSLYASNGLCDASDAHFAARLTISTDSVNRAVKELDAAGLVVKVTTRVNNVLYRTLTPEPAAITAAAATNPYPQNAGTPYPQNAARGTRKMPEGYPQNAATGTRILPVGVPAKCGINTPSNIPSNFHLNPTDAACAAGGESEKKLEDAGQPEKPSAQASHTEGGAADVATSIKPAKKAKATGPVESPEFLAFWAAYPRHDKKEAALAAFTRLPAEDQAQAADRAARWLARRTDWITPEGKDYRPYPASWLNQKRWQELAEPLPTPIAQPDATYDAPTRATRPLNGAKPNGEAADLAAALFDYISQ